MATDELKWPNGVVVFLGILIFAYICGCIWRYGLDVIEPFMEEVMQEKREEKYYDYSDMTEMDSVVEEYLQAVW